MWESVAYATWWFMIAGLPIIGGLTFVIYIFYKRSNPDSDSTTPSPTLENPSFPPTPPKELLNPWSTEPRHLPPPVDDKPSTLENLLTEKIRSGELSLSFSLKDTEVEMLGKKWTVKAEASAPKKLKVPNPQDDWRKAGD